MISTVDRSAALINVLLSKESSDLTSSSIAVTILVVEGGVNTSGPIKSPMTRIGAARSVAVLGTIRFILTLSSWICTRANAAKVWAVFRDEAPLSRRKSRPSLRWICNSGMCPENEGMSCSRLISSS